MAARRSPWLTERAEMLARLLSERHGLVISDDTACDNISGHVEFVATMMRIGERAAKVYVTDDVVSDMAERLAKAVRDHQDAVARGDVADLTARRERP